MITSTGNAKVKELVQLQKKAKNRNKEGVFIVEGGRIFTEIPKELLVQVYVSESFYEKNREMLAQGAYPVEVLSDTVFDYAADTRTPQGILCVVRQLKYCLEDLIAGEAPHILVLDNLQDPGNLGTIIRTAEGAGVTAIIMSRDCVDVYNPKVTRSTMGSLFRVPFVYVEDLPEAVAELKKYNISVFAAHLQGKNAYDEENYSGGSAFLIGNEGNGLSEEVADTADIRVRIPMCGKVESLNAAVAASVLMFEVSRQRRRNGKER
ncbi:TrmH family RNA methyltransferase [Hespellia stercorisuis]|uniref:RNA methyltransferase, TrmH family n=1 Tax=Hespellia stercorisuis DSM 15480 TaxID=1121950 RepID=A0A1M6NG74_9FIRM|nr:RNA methyltransferase [Hespellia stercorisuis]SHJ94593.1 RNA methyltransferase, TrmH family [Hespellia stercorisuis DSM 15480]